ncbi:MAG: hypothetical protein ITG02_06730 [Patulibacter sp.]|nr:hypothetical protein [Patulibacter sp.]
MTTITGGVLAVAAVLGVLLAGEAARAGVAVGIALALTTTAPLAVADRFPCSVAALSAVSAGLATALGYGDGLSGIATLFAVGLAATRLEPRTAVALGMGVTLALVGGLFLAPGARPPAASFASNAAVVGLATLAGAAWRAQRRHATELEAHAAELEGLRDIQTREAIAREHLRVAREVHDVVGHALAGITLHARVAERHLSPDAEPAATSLADIAALASSALAETREVVDRMRSGHESPLLRPASRIDDLDELVAGLRSADLTIDLRRTGDVGAVPTLVQAAAFRIVQESLSNVARHATPATATVTVARSHDRLEIEIVDDGRRTRSAAGPPTGHGLRGMQERAVGLGGTFDAAPRPAGGWRVRATLPLGQAA